MWQDTHYCHAHAKNWYGSQIPHISHICQSVHVHIWHTNMSTYASYEPNAISNVTRNTVMHIFHIIGIWTWTNMPVSLHICPTALLLWSTYRPHITVHTSQKICNRYSINYCQICAWHNHGPQIPHICNTCQLVHALIWGNFVNIYIYTSYELTIINSATRCTAIHVFHFIGICPWTNMPATSHIYVPLH